MDGDLRKLQLIELELFKKLAQICEENDITYFALGGTLLGAVRHKGFIPWDDDMDIGIPRPDYERLCCIMEASTLEENFLFRTWHNDSEWIRYFAHFENTEATLVRHDKKIYESTHAWIDVFPLDAMPNNAFLRKIKKIHVTILCGLYKFSQFDTLVNVYKKNRPFHERVLIFIGLHTPIQKILNTRKFLSRLEKVITKTSYEESEFLVNAMGAYRFKEMFHKKYYGDGRMYQFEDTEIRGPVDYDYVCKQLYGDYMTPPPEDDRNHHGLVNVE